MSALNDNLHFHLCLRILVYWLWASTNLQTMVWWAIVMVLFKL